MIELPASGYHFTGSAKWVNGQYIELTPNRNSQAGSAFSKSNGPHWDSSNFQIEFDLFVGARDRGADGLAFTVLDDARNTARVGANGGGLGSQGLKGYTIEFDTWHNRGQDQTSADHVTMWIDGVGGTRVTNDAAVSNIEDNRCTR